MIATGLIYSHEDGTMQALLERVIGASVDAGDQVTGSIGRGGCPDVPIRLDSRERA